MTDFNNVLAELRTRITGGETFDYEAMLQEVYSKWIQPGDTAADIGAHVGRHLRHLYDAVGETGTVLAFEPLPFAYESLCENYARPNIQIHNVALAEEAGTSSFVHAQGTPEESGLRKRIYNRGELADPTIITVNVGRLDDYTTDLAELNFVKIDTEGGEIGCLKGATETLAKYRPVVSVEYGSPSFTAYGLGKFDLFDLAGHRGFVMYDIFLNRLNRADWELAVDSIYWDFLMVPTEACAKFEARVRR